MPKDSCFPKREDSIIQDFGNRMSWDKRRFSEGDVLGDDEKTQSSKE